MSDTWDKQLRKARHASLIANWALVLTMAYLVGSSMWLNHKLAEARVELELCQQGD